MRLGILALLLVTTSVARADTDPKAFLGEFCAAHAKRDAKYIGHHVRLPVRVETRIGDNIEHERFKRTTLGTVRRVLAHALLCDDTSAIEVDTDTAGTWVFKREIGQFDQRMTFDHVTTTPRLTRLDL